MSIKLADTLAPMANFPVAMAENIAFNDNENLQEKYDSEILKKSDLAEYMNRIDKCIYSQVGQKVGCFKGYLREYHRINKVVVIGNSITMHVEGRLMVLNGRLMTGEKWPQHIQIQAG